jgi:hypothetical protein
MTRFLIIGRKNKKLFIVMGINDQLSKPIKTHI